MSPEQAVIARERDASPPRETDPSASDDCLAKRAVAGDPDAFAAIFRRYERDLYNYCVGILGEPQDAQDAIQNTIVKVLRALPGERRKIQLKPWLYRIAHNEAIELRRRQRPVEQLGAEMADSGISVAEHAERSERLQVLFRDMTELPQRQRAALVMRELNGLEFGEIGAVLGTSPSAVRQALYEARRGLQQMELGRQLDCDAVTRTLSDGDGQLRGRREARAHLRHCSDCRRFRREIGDRKQSLAAISPLPTFVAGALLKSALAGSAAGAGSAGLGGAGAAAGLAGGVTVSSGLVKSVAGFLAVVAIGTAAADRTGMIDLQGGPAAAVERDAGSQGRSHRGGRDGSPERGGRSKSGLAAVESRPAASAGSATGGRERVERLDGSAARFAAAGRMGFSANEAANASPAQGEIRAPATVPVAAPGEAGKPQATAAPEHPEPQPKPDKGRQKEKGVRSEKAPQSGTASKSEAKTEKTEARTEKKQAKAEAKTEKAQSKAEAREEKGPKSGPQGGAPAPPSTESPPPSESSGHPAPPEHPSHPAEQPKQETPAPEVESIPAPESTAAPTEAGPGNGNGNGNGKGNGNGSKQAAPTPSE